MFITVLLIIAAVAAVIIIVALIWAVVTLKALRTHQELAKDIFKDVSKD